MSNLWEIKKHRIVCLCGTKGVVSQQTAQALELQVWLWDSELVENLFTLNWDFKENVTLFSLCYWSSWDNRREKLCIGVCV